MTRAVVALSTVAIAAGVAGASPLNLVPGRPDVHSGFISVSYDFPSSTLTASGFADQLTLNFVDPSINLSNPLRAFTLSAVINHDGTFSGVGSVSVFGNYPSSSSALLLSGGSLSQFGFNGTALEFVFSSGGGTLNPLHGNVGVILSDPSFTFPGFGASFNNVSAGEDARSDTFLIPAPGAAALCGVCALFAFSRRRR